MHLIASSACRWSGYVSISEAKNYLVHIPMPLYH